MNIIKREVKASRLNILIWSFAFFFLSYAGIIKFDSIIGDGTTGVVDLLNRIPRVILALFNMVDLDITYLPDYFSIIASYLMVMVASQGLFLGIGLFAKEEQRKTADFLLTKPRSRTRIYLQKVASGIVIILLLQLVVFLCNWSALQDYLPGVMTMLKNYTLALAVVHLLFFGLGVLLVNILPRGRAETAGLAAILISYFVPVLANMSERYYQLRDYFPFNMFLQRSMEQPGGTPVVKLMILFVLALLFIIIGMKKFEKNDIYV